MLQQTQKDGAACQAGLAVDLIVGLAVSHLPACLPAREWAQKPVSL